MSTCPDCKKPSDSGNGWHRCPDDAGLGVEIDNLRENLAEARRVIEQMRAVLQREFARVAADCIAYLEPDAWSKRVASWSADSDLGSMRDAIAAADRFLGGGE